MFPLSLLRSGKESFVSMAKDEADGPSEGRRPRALITGASRGHRSSYRQISGPTHHVLLGGRDAGALATLAEFLPSASPWALGLADTHALAHAVDGIDNLDVLVHSGGIWQPGRIGETSS
jgi:NADP-dependent 3-hydroxy acid dehydrogenase YdfG